MKHFSNFIKIQQSRCCDRSNEHRQWMKSKVLAVFAVGWELRQWWNLTLACRSGSIEKVATEPHHLFPLHPKRYQSGVIDIEIGLTCVGNFGVSRRNHSSWSHTWAIWISPLAWHSGKFDHLIAQFELILVSFACARLCFGTRWAKGAGWPTTAKIPHANIQEGISKYNYLRTFSM